MTIICVEKSIETSIVLVISKGSRSSLFRTTAGGIAGRRAAPASVTRRGAAGMECAAGKGTRNAASSNVSLVRIITAVFTRVSRLNVLISPCNCEQGLSMSKFFAEILDIIVAFRVFIRGT